LRGADIHVGERGGSGGSGGSADWRRSASAHRQSRERHVSLQACRLRLCVLGRVVAAVVVEFGARLLLVFVVIAVAAELVLVGLLHIIDAVSIVLLVSAQRPL
jgi:hypothetical protein